MVAIKDFKMPKSCASCDLVYETENCYAKCGAGCGAVWKYISNQTKHEDCPLVEVEVKE